MNPHQGFDFIMEFIAEEHIVENPAGGITQELWDSVEWGLKHLPRRIRVIGEEDLAAVVVFLLAPIGASVLYGLDEKLVVVTVTEKLKQEAKKLLA